MRPRPTAQASGCESMKRSPFTILSAVSLLLCVLFLFLWVATSQTPLTLFHLSEDETQSNLLWFSARQGVIGVGHHHNEPAITARSLDRSIAHATAYLMDVENSTNAAATSQDRAKVTEAMQKEVIVRTQLVKLYAERQGLPPELTQTPGFHWSRSLN